MIGPGPRNLITDVEGVLVGNAEDEAVRTGATVVLPEAGQAVTAVDLRGGASGTRNVAALDTSDFVAEFHAIVLSGGSEFGLAAADGVVEELTGRGVGLAMGPRPIPVVSAAILFDLMNGGEKGWRGESPYRMLGLRAAAAAGKSFSLGNAGAGFGAAAGALKGGLGSASAVDGESGIVVGALIAVNSVGSTVIPGTAAFWAWPFEMDGEFGGERPALEPLGPSARDPFLDSKLAARQSGMNTTIGVVATDAVLDRAGARRLAMMAQDGLARAIRPIHSTFDGDTLFAMATGRKPLEPGGPRGIARLGALAADCVARAVARGVYAAESLGDLKSYRDFFGSQRR